ncbi:hypothetical protein SAMN04488527_10542 [Aliiroseovarius crassostreae]|uniref:Uncharacterized protein n=1 Tax=Aliiroseovarius crassostreae TaxID=154981 RepID=A0A0P7J3G6_9RHOB|nr:DUF6476 family protein [Aliiroseovarius crassostreae]KPN62223.1 hypothetical protein AKJ29_08155 [Aliiroseovarius crassostreae]SFU53122.1 hypothetical protein SAMN04488527_10542 [Aliiroseovarius crassostreae]
MDNTPQDEITTDTPIDGTVRFLKILVTTLTATTIIGLIVLITVIVMRVQEIPTIPLPDLIPLPDGAQAVSFTQAGDWYAVITDANQILIFDRASGDLRQTIQVAPASN